MVATSNISNPAARPPARTGAARRHKAWSRGPYARITSLLEAGGEIETPVDVHEYVGHEMPRKAALTLVSVFAYIKPNDKAMERALGMSERTLHRFKAAPREQNKPLDANQGSRVWAMADVVSKAKEVLGSLEEAERWLTSPAIGLNSKRPIDLMGTMPGAEVVKNLLERMEYGVYT